jgi:nucleotide-binding universal stress UspA family protein
MASSSTRVGISIRNILLPTDFSPSSERALEYGVCIARRFAAALNIVTVVPEEIVDYVQPPDPFYLHHCAEKNMARVAQSDILRDVAHREFVKDGRISSTIPFLESQLDIDMVVLGAHIRSRVKQFVAGSAAEKIINGSPCSVIAIGPKDKKASMPQWKLQRILFATDLAPGSATALAYGLWLAEQEHAQLTLLHVLKPSASSTLQPETDSCRSRLASIVPPNTTVPIELLVQPGVPAQQILKVAEELDVDLILIGPRDTSSNWAATHLPWLTSHHVLCHAFCPVLTVHDGWTISEWHS